MQHPKVSVIVLNWNGKVDTLECLESVRKIDYPNCDIIVVDNGSADDSIKVIKKEFPEVILIETGENLGFAEGNNVGIRYALGTEAEYILVLNNDTIVDPQLIRNFLASSTIDRKAGIFGAKIYYYSQPDKIWHAGGRWVSRISGFIHVGMGCLDTGKDFDSVVETDYVSGCAFFIKAEVLRKIGLFDEKFFLTFEETDLCYRARRAGFKTFFVPDAKVWHKVSASFGGEESPLFNYFMDRNILLWAEKHLPLGDKLKLYRNILKELFRAVLPPRIASVTAEAHMRHRWTFELLRNYKEAYRKKLKDPARKAKLLASRDYILRRFGNCPESTRSLRG